MENQGLQVKGKVKEVSEEDKGDSIQNIGEGLLLMENEHSYKGNK